MTNAKEFSSKNWLVTLLLLVAAMVVPSTAWAQPTITPAQPTHGDGTAENPYQISSAAELYWFAELVNGSLTDGTLQNTAACAKLTADITVNSNLLSSLNIWDGEVWNSETFTSWTPIGKKDENEDENGYIGTFDGDGKTVSGLFLNDSNADYVGLFGLIGSGGTVKNVGVVDSYFKARYRVGGLCGENYWGTISNCYNTGTVSCKISTDWAVDIGGVCGINFCGTITNCHNTGAVSGEYQYQGNNGTMMVYAGGVCGENQDGTIVNCYNTGTVNGKTTISPGIYVGGVCAYSDGSIGISNCYNTGNVTGESASEYGYVKVGGVCASNGASISNCYSTGTVEGIAPAPESGTVFSGGLCGETSGNISNCYYNSDMFTGGAFGEKFGTATNVDGKTTAQFASGEVAYLLNGSKSGVAENEEPLVWYQNLAEEDGDACPVLKKTATNTVYQVNLICGGVKELGATYANTNEDKILAHDLPETVPFNSTKKIYDKVCQREGCGVHLGYFADAAGTIEATPNAEATEFTVVSYTLTDAILYDSKAEFTVTDFTYNRTFSHDKWVAVYVPFEINCGELPTDMEMAVVNNFHEYEQEDGTYNVVLEVKRKTSGTIPALTPCVMRMKTALTEATEKEIRLTNVPFSPAADKYIDCSSVERYYKFTGSLAGIEKYIFNEKRDFVLNQGKLNKANEKTSLKAQRWYLSATDRNGNSSASIASLRSIAIEVVGESDVTGIEDIHVITEREAPVREGIYDLQGRKLNSEPAEGVYIKNGIKYVK